MQKQCVRVFVGHPGKVVFVFGDDTTECLDVDVSTRDGQLRIAERAAATGMLPACGMDSVDEVAEYVAFVAGSPHFGGELLTADPAGPLPPGDA